MPEKSYAGTTPAPAFPANVEWLNTDRPLSLEQLKGKVIILDFWTYGCINCIHVLPDLKRLEAKYPNELVVIGVHSAKFLTEGDTDNIRQIILRYGIEHPVINDNQFKLWQAYGVQAWPTLVIVDPAGNVVGGQSGEGIYDLFDEVVGSLVREFEANGQIDRTPLDIKLEKEGLPETVLSFPGKVEASEDGRLFIADTNHNRIVVADAQTGAVHAVFGNGQRGFQDGSAQTARFQQPQGMAYDVRTETLYVADTENHAIRRIDITTGNVTTVAGIGSISDPYDYPGAEGPGKETALNSPWDLELVGDTLYIAMAGSHSLYSLDLPSNHLTRFAGTGREALEDGARLEAGMNQPSGLTTDGERLYIADAEASAIRYVGFAPSATLDTIVGTGLFDFGDKDGIGEDVLLQHPLGVKWHQGLIYVVDTYNSKIKTVNPITREAFTFAGGGEGWRDGTDPAFFEPGGLDIQGETLYVADTNNHSIRIIDLATKATRTLTLTGIEKFMATAVDEGYVGDNLTLDSITVGAGNGEIQLNITVPDGYKINTLAPQAFVWSVAGEAITLDAPAQQTLTAPTFPVTIPTTFSEGQSTLTGDLTIYYCTADQETLCLIQQARLTIPVTVTASGSTILPVTYAVPEPAFLY